MSRSLETLERIATALEQAIPLLQTVVKNSRRASDTAGSFHNPQDSNGVSPLEPPALDSLPGEVSTAEAAKILGVSKDTVLKLKDDGMLEYRNAAAPSSSRPIFLFLLQSVLTVRTTYRTDSPAPWQKPDAARRAAAPRKRYKHLRLSGS